MKMFPRVVIQVNVIDQNTGAIVHSGRVDFSDDEGRRWIAETCRVAFSQGHKVTSTPVVGE